DLLPAGLPGLPPGPRVRGHGLLDLGPGQAGGLQGGLPLSLLPLDLPRGRARGPPPPARLLALCLGDERRGWPRPRSIDYGTAGGGGLVVRQVLGLVGVQPEAGRDQQQDAGPEQEAALALQAGLAEQAFEGAVRHVTLSGSAGSSGWTGPPAGCGRPGCRSA